MKCCLSCFVSVVVLFYAVPGRGGGGGEKGGGGGEHIRKRRTPYFFYQYWYVAYLDQEIPHHFLRVKVIGVRTSRSTRVFD